MKKLPLNQNFIAPFFAAALFFFVTPVPAQDTEVTSIEEVIVTSQRVEESL